MYYVGVDPGANFSGLAVLDGQTNSFTEYGAFERPTELWHVLREWISLGTDCVTVAIEDFLGSGASNTYRKKTVMALGYIQYRCEESGADIEVVPQQVRLAYVGLVPSEITQKDEIAAAAHALALQERRDR